MLDMYQKLSFPRLQYVKKSVLIKKKYAKVSTHPDEGKWEVVGDEAKPVTLFKLDWSNHLPRPHEDDTALPKEWEKYFDDLLFSLNSNYLNEIHRQSQLAYTEWGRSRSFDTMIRDICLAPVASHVRVAFRLICDCVFDEEKKYYRKHDWVRYLAPNALVYKFWYGQTGNGLLWFKAKMDEKEEFLKRPDAMERIGEDIHKQTSLFLHSLRKHEEARENLYAKNRIVSET